MIDLSTPLGDFKKKGKIVNVEIHDVEVAPGDMKKKANLIVALESAKEIRVNSVLVSKYNKSVVQQGLWCSTDKEGKLSPLCNLGRFLRQQEANNMNDLIGMEIDLFLGDKDLLVGKIK